jgi:hypothetical protein
VYSKPRTSLALKYTKAKCINKAQSLSYFLRFIATIYFHHTISFFIYINRPKQ